MNEEEDINSNRNNYVTGVVIDSNNPVFRTSSDAQFINAENPIEASDVITVGDNQYRVPDASIYRDAITIQKKRNTIIVLSSVDIAINLIRVISGSSYYYYFYMICAGYGYIGAKEFNYRYMSIYTIYLFLVMISNFLMCINYYYSIESQKEYAHQNNTTLSTGQYNIIKINNYFNMISFLATTYIYYYASDFKNALKNYHQDNEAIVIEVQ